VKEQPPELQPNVPIVFWSFRIMVAMGLLMVLVAVIGLFLRRNKAYMHKRWYLQTLRLMTLSPFIAVLAGWFVTEVGRAPYLIYGQMTHAEGVTPSLTGGMALFTLIGYFLVYAFVFAAGAYYLTRVIRTGTEGTEQHDDEKHRPKRPLSAAEASFD